MTAAQIEPENDPSKEKTVAEKTPPKKTAAKKTAASAAKPAGGKVTIYLVGESYNGAHGDRRITDEETAAELVKAGLARYAGTK